MLKFLLPSGKNRGDVQDFYAEMATVGDSCIGCAGWKDYERWMTGMQNRHTGTNLPEGYVREDFFLCYDKTTLVGVFSLKFELTAYLLQFGGHIGYVVRPSLRRRGFAAQMLRQGLALAKDAGLTRVLCVCDADNPASEQVIRKNGGILEDERYDPEEQVFVKRFWICL